MARKSSNRFDSINQPIACHMCGKMTTTRIDGMVGLDLCRGCLEATQIENEHFDGYHDADQDGPRVDCKHCQKAAEDAAAAAPVAEVVATMAGDLQIGDVVRIDGDHVIAGASVDLVVEEIAPTFGHLEGIGVRFEGDPRMTTFARSAIVDVVRPAGPAVAEEAPAGILGDVARKVAGLVDGSIVEAPVDPAPAFIFGRPVTGVDATYDRAAADPAGDDLTPATDGSFSVTIRQDDISELNLPALLTAPVEAPVIAEVPAGDLVEGDIIRIPGGDLTVVGNWAAGEGMRALYLSPGRPGLAFFEPASKLFSVVRRAQAPAGDPMSNLISFGNVGPFVTFRRSDGNFYTSGAFGATSIRLNRPVDVPKNGATFSVVETDFWEIITTAGDILRSEKSTGEMVSLRGSGA